MTIKVDPAVILGHMIERLSVDGSVSDVVREEALSLLNSKLEAIFAEVKSFNCSGCGREEGECSANPCAGVVADRSEGLPPDPENMNEDRAKWASEALLRFQMETGTDLEDALADLLGDLMHWADRNGRDFETDLERARRYYAEETDPEGC